jgi:hypothetical protein
MRAGVTLAFAFMDIHTAAGYMKHGYRIKRPVWKSVDYIYDFHGRIMGSFSNSCTKGEFSLSLDLQDLLADDWELILEGIVNDFGIIQYEESK